MGSGSTPLQRTAESVRVPARCVDCYVVDTRNKAGIESTSGDPDGGGSVTEPHNGGDRPHLPGPSLYPIGFAAGIACILVGLIVNPKIIVPIGAVVAIISGFLWARQATKELRAQPVHDVEAERGEVVESTDAPPIPAHQSEAAMPEPEPGERFPRSKFLEFSTLGLGAAIGGLVTIPVLGFMVVPAFKDQGYPDVDLGPLENFTEGQWFITKFF